MKYFIILAIFLAISVHTIVSQDDPDNSEPPAGVDNPPDEGNDNPPDSGDNPSDEGNDNPPDNGDNPSDEGNDIPPESGNTGGDENAGNNPGTSNDNVSSGGNDTNENPGTNPGETDNNESSDTNNGTATGGSGNSTTETNAMKVSNVIQNLPAKCSNRYSACYGPASTVNDIKNKDIRTTDDDKVCELIEDGEDCVTTANENFVCTDDEYEKVQDQACDDARRSAVFSVVMIGVLSLISKILSQH